MRTAPYSDILRGSAALIGATLEDLLADPTALALFRAFHTRRLKLAWEIHRWPDVCRLEKRVFAPVYTTGSSWLKGQNVYFPPTNSYYQACRDNANQPPATLSGNVYVLNAGYWARAQAVYGGADYSATTPLTVGDIKRLPADGEFYHYFSPPLYMAATFYYLQEATPTEDHVTLVQTGTQSGKPFYEGRSLNDIYLYLGWSEGDGVWYLATNADGGYASQYLRSTQTVATPNLVTAWLPGPLGYGGEGAGSSVVQVAGTPLPPPSPVSWHKLIPFHRELNELEVLNAWDRDPKVTTRRCELRFEVTNTGVRFAPQTPASVHVEYRLLAPTLAGEIYSATRSYAAGEQVYFTPATTRAGNFYTALTAVTANANQDPASNPTAWQILELPYIFRDYLVQGGYADWLTQDGQTDKAAAAETFAASLLELEADKLQRQQRQTRRIGFHS